MGRVDGVGGGWMRGGEVGVKTAVRILPLMKETIHGAGSFTVSDVAKSPLVVLTTSRCLSPVSKTLVSFNYTC